MAVAAIDLSFDFVDLSRDTTDIALQILQDINAFENNILGLEAPVVTDSVISDAAIALQLSEEINYDAPVQQPDSPVSHPRPRGRPRAPRPRAPVISPVISPFQPVVDPGEECSICYEKFARKRCVKLKCGHIYHKACIKKWGKTSMVCPMDRKKFRISELK